MTALERYAAAARAVGCPREQVERFVRAGVVLQPRQLAASAAARLCDRPDGPTAVGYGGARGGGKSHWLLAQMGADDCQRMPGLKCLLLRKVGKANMENFEDLRRRLFGALAHEFSAYRGVLKFANGSRIIAGHFQSEKDIDAYLGLEYDVIGIEEATTLSSRKHQDISTCSRTSKANWRPRIYSTTNPGGIGHAWYRAKFIVPHLKGVERETRFIPARVGDNHFNNPEYTRVLANLTGWQKRAWFDGDWDIAAGQFFTTLRRDAQGECCCTGMGAGDRLQPPESLASLVIHDADIFVERANGRGRTGKWYGGPRAKFDASSRRQRASRRRQPVAVAVHGAGHGLQHPGHGAECEGAEASGTSRSDSTCRIASRFVPPPAECRGLRSRSETDHRPAPACGRAIFLAERLWREEPDGKAEHLAARSRGVAAR